MAKKPKTLRIDEELWAEVGKAGKKLRPIEKHTEFIEKASWDRVRKLKRMDKLEQEDKQ